MMFSRRVSLWLTTMLASSLCYVALQPARAQLDDDDFFDRGRDILESEIDRLENAPPEIDLDVPDGQAAETPNWHQLVAEGAQFAVAVPGPPQTYDEVAIDTPEGLLNFVGWLANYGQSQFIVAYSEYPTSTPRPADRLTALRDRMVEDTGWTITEDASNPFGVYPGRKFILFNEAQMIAYRFYLVEQRLYILGVLQPPELDLATESAAFFNSFQLLPPDFELEDILPPGSISGDETQPE
ncbi:MAG: hypothetical protein F6J87_16080 [Spirulina sp. SIO3F2]|nr:hypothetical protein [Spirulina sp. SIO3F2]